MSKHAAREVHPADGMAPAAAYWVARSLWDSHNADGQRWVGFPRADRLQAYCTTCGKASPCWSRQLLDAAMGQGAGE